MTFRFSPSQMSLVYECPRCYYREHVEGIKRPRGPFPGLPGAIDRLLQSKTAKLAGKGRPSWLLPDLKGKGIIKQGTKRMTAEGEHFVVTGIVDDIIVTGDNSIIIVDYKTAARPYTHEMAVKYYGLQMDFYAYLCEKNNLTPVEKAYLVFTTPAYLENCAYTNSFGINFKVTHIALDVDAQRAKDAIRKGVEICLQEEAPPASEGCEYCHYRNQN